MPLSTITLPRMLLSASRAEIFSIPVGLRRCEAWRRDGSHSTCHQRLCTARIVLSVQDRSRSFDPERERRGGEELLGRRALLLLLIAPAYGLIASKVNRIKLISCVTLFFMSHLVIFYLLGHGGVHIGILFSCGSAFSMCWSWRYSGALRMTCTLSPRENVCFRLSAWARRYWPGPFTANINGCCRAKTRSQSSRSDEAA